MSNVICLVSPQNGSWVLFTILQNSLYRSSLYRGLSVNGILVLTHISFDRWWKISPNLNPKIAQYQPPCIYTAQFLNSNCVQFLWNFGLPIYNFSLFRNRMFAFNDIDQGILHEKSNVAPKKNYRIGSLIHTYYIDQILKHFTGTFRWTQTSYIWRISF